MEEKKILENELDKVAGGQETAEQAVNKPIVSQKAFDEMRAVLEEDLPVAVCDELGRTKSDVEFCRLLAENGIDVQKLQAQDKCTMDEVLATQKEVVAYSEELNAKYPNDPLKDVETK